MGSVLPYFVHYLLAPLDKLLEGQRQPKNRLFQGGRFQAASKNPAWFIESWTLLFNMCWFIPYVSCDVYILTQGMGFDCIFVLPGILNLNFLKYFPLVILAGVSMSWNPNMKMTEVVSPQLLQINEQMKLSLTIDLTMVSSLTGSHSPLCLTGCFS